MRNESGTIAAISTAMSNSGIGIVRMSGEEAVEIAERIYKGKNEKKLSKQPTHTIHYGYIVDGEDTIDEVLVMLMRGPHSYTGEDTVELLKQARMNEDVEVVHYAITAMVELSKEYDLYRQNYCGCVYSQRDE